MFFKFMRNVLRTFVEVYKEFSLQSSIHGVKYIILAKSKLARLMWVIILLSSFLIAGQLASLFYERHQSASMSTLIISAQYPTFMLKLPALTLCHGGIAMTHKMVPYMTSQKRIYMPRGLTRADFEKSIKYLREAIYPKNYFPNELDKLQQILSANRLSLLELFENISPNCSDFLLMCQLVGQTVPCSKLIEPVITYNGICCAFNHEYFHESLQRPTKLLEQLSIGSDNFILSLLMRSYLSQDRLASIMYGDGVKVMVHERSTYPSSKAIEFMAAAGHETIARLGGTRLTSTSEVLKMSARTRGCSTSTGSRLYRSDNCQIKCNDLAIWKFCDCQPLSAAPVEHGKQACDLSHIPCLARAFLRTHRILENDPQCACLPDCESTTYRVSLATAPLDAVQYSPTPFYKKVLQYQNVTALHFTFAGKTAMLHQRKLVLSQENLLSSLGGIFGLFLGCSIISILEIIYFFSTVFIGKLRSIKSPEKNIIQTKLM